MKFNDSFLINGKPVGAGCPTYIIAEMSANHGKDYGRAVEMIHAAKESGADAIKLQTYTADTLTIDCKSDFFYINKGPWRGQYLYDLYKNASMPWEWHKKLKEEADRVGITLFSTPFDYSSIELLEDLDVPAYKIASPEFIELPLLRKVAQTQKPVIMSTGYATLSDIYDAVKVMSDEGARDICLLKCTSTYPASPDLINLKTIPHMRDCFSCQIGLSDHSLGIGVSVASVAFGACVIEKHFILDKKIETADSFFSLTPEEFKILVDAVRVAEKAIGEVSYPLERDSHRSLVAFRKIAKGDVVSSANVRSIRPGGGMEPKNMELIQGRVAVTDIEIGMPISWEIIGEKVV